MAEQAAVASSLYCDMQVCCSHAQAGYCPYGARCRFLHSEDIAPCHFTIHAGHEPVNQCLHSQHAHLSAEHQPHLHHAPFSQSPPVSYPVSQAPQGNPSSFMFPSYNPPQKSHQASYSNQKPTFCPSRMLPQYTKSHFPTQQDNVTHLWPTDSTNDTSIGVYSPAAPFAPAATQHAENAKHHANNAMFSQLLTSHSKRNIWADIDPMVEARQISSRNADPALACSKLSASFRKVCPTMCFDLTVQWFDRQLHVYVYDAVAGACL